MTIKMSPAAAESLARTHASVMTNSRAVAEQAKRGMEEMCEKALQSGTMGVLVSHRSMGVTEISLSHDVPYGTIQVQGSPTFDLPGSTP